MFYNSLNSSKLETSKIINLSTVFDNTFIVCTKILGLQFYIQNSVTMPGSTYSECIKIIYFILTPTLSSMSPLTSLSRQDDCTSFYAFKSMAIGAYNLHFPQFDPIQVFELHPGIIIALSILWPKRSIHNVL